MHIELLLVKDIIEKFVNLFQIIVIFINSELELRF